MPIGISRGTASRVRNRQLQPADPARSRALPAGLCSARPAVREDHRPATERRGARGRGPQGSGTRAPARASGRPRTGVLRRRSVRGASPPRRRGFPSGRQKPSRGPPRPGIGLEAEPDLASGFDAGVSSRTAPALAVSSVPEDRGHVARMIATRCAAHCAAECRAKTRIFAGPRTIALHISFPIERLSRFSRGISGGAGRRLEPVSAETVALSLMPRSDRATRQVRRGHWP